MTSRWLSCLVALVSLSACAADEPLTQIMVVVRSDISTLDALDIDVTGSGAKQTSHAMLDKQHPLPRTLALVPDGSGLGPVTVVARGLTAKRTIIERKAKLSFIKGRNLALVLDLSAQCVTKYQGCTTSAADTCITDHCASSTVVSSKLANFHDKSQWLDAGSAKDAGADAMADADVSASDAADDASNAPDTGEPDASMMSMPDAGPVKCKPHTADCGGPPDCETRTDTLDHCGDCDTSCKFDPGIGDPHAMASCKADKCSFKCAKDFVNFDNDPIDGCESRAFGFLPSNLDATSKVYADALSPALTIDCEASIDLGTGDLDGATIKICGQSVHAVVTEQTGGPELAVIPLTGLNITDKGKLHLVGTRPIVFVVYGDATVAGSIDASAADGVSGPGANVSCVNGLGGTGEGGTYGGGGGGGGGFGTSGGDGSKGSTTVTDVDPGLSGKLEATNGLSPLRGGCKGGDGGTGLDLGGAAGGGGGAVQLSVAGQLTITGMISAAGGGGQAPSGSGNGGGGGGGGGGGSGGAILVEAGNLKLMATAWLTANGGGGGEGTSQASATASSGTDGSRTNAMPAAGGTSGNYGGDGGNGASATNAAAKAGAAAITGFPVRESNGGGGGGGGLGVIVVTGKACLLDGMASPAAAVGCP